MKKRKYPAGLCKRLGAVALAAVMAVGLSACKSSGTTKAGSDQKVSLTFWDIWTADPQKTMVDNMISEWNQKNPNIQVTRSTTANDPYKTKIKTAVAADEAPDVYFAWPCGFTQPFVDSGKVLQIDKYLTKEVKAKMLPGALVTFNGKNYGVNSVQQVGTLFVNTAIMSANGLTTPKTFDDLLSDVKTLHAKGIVPLCVGEKDEWPGMWYYDMLALRDAGADTCVSALNKKTSFNTQPFIDAATQLQQLVQAGAFDQGALGISRDDSEVAFLAGKEAMYYGLNTFAGKVKGSSVDGKIEVAPFPSVSGGKGDSTEFLGGGVDCLLVSKNTKAPDQAVKFALWLSEEISDQFYLNGCGLPQWEYTQLDQSKVYSLNTDIMTKITKGAKDSVEAWDIYLMGNDAQVHKDLVAEIFGNKTTPQQFAQQMQQQVGQS